MTTNDVGAARSGLQEECSPAAEAARFSTGRLGGPEASRLAQQRARLIRWEKDRHSASPAWRAPWVWGGGLAVSAVLLVWLALPSSVEPAPVGAGGTPDAVAVADAVREVPKGETATPLGASLDGRPLAADAWVNAERGPLTVVFSDESRVSLSDGSRARLTGLDEAGVHFAIESGELTASVVPGGKHRWVFKAGPYRVAVLGTVLKVAWEPKTEQLTVSVSRGKVSVAGGQIDGEGRTVAAGESFSVSTPAAVDASEPSPNFVRGKTARNITVPPTSIRDASPTKRVKEPNANSALAGGATSRWKAFAQQAQYKRALEAAEAEGMDALLGSAGPADLRLLADAARLAGAPQRASKVLMALRRRYPGHSNASVAAFTLGRMAYEVEHNNKSAARWFRTYLASAPSGSLAEAARGRLMLSLSRMGDKKAARRAAKTYLSMHPRGPHASTARSLLSNR